MITKITDFKKINEQKLNESNDYQRVIPRDFFNESKLLKCMGFLAIHELNGTVPNGIELSVHGDGEFKISQDGMHNLLTVSNYTVIINDMTYLVGTEYNSKDTNPMVVIVEDDVDIRILDEQNNFTQEFIDRFKFEEDEEDDNND